MTKINRDIDWLFIIPMDKLSGGAEQLIMNLTNYLIGKGENCCIIFLSKKRFGDWEYLSESCKIIYAPFKSVFLGYIYTLIFLIRFSNKYSIKRSFTSQTVINGMMGFLKKIGILKNTKVIVRESNSIFHLLEGWKLKRYIIAYKIGYGNVDLLICQTTFMKNQLITAMKWKKSQINTVVLPNPINLSEIQKKGEGQSPFIHDKRYIVAAGRLVKAKGFDLLIEAYAQINRYYPDLVLIILGDGPERQSLKEKIRTFGLADKVKLVGHVKNVYPYFKNALVCVISSRIEGFPNVLLQMMSQNTKVVCTLSAGDIDKIDGIFTCEVENIIDLKKSLIACIESDTKINRFKFDNELNKRTVKSFLNNTLNSIKES